MWRLYPEGEDKSRILEAYEEYLGREGLSPVGENGELVDEEHLGIMCTTVGENDLGFDEWDYIQEELDARLGRIVFLLNGKEFYDENYASADSLIRCNFADPITWDDHYHAAMEYLYAIKPKEEKHEVCS